MITFHPPESRLPAKNPTASHGHESVIAGSRLNSGKLAAAISSARRMPSTRSVRWANSDPTNVPADNVVSSSA